MKIELLDDFTDLSGWTAVVSGQAQLNISQDQKPGGQVMRLGFDFKDGGGFVVARKPCSFTLPEAFAFSCKLRGVAPANKFEFKLVDPSGQNVWRYQQEAFDFSQEWRPLRIKSSQIEFAWGPAGGGTPHRVGAIELVIAAGPGGKGTVWVDDLRLEDHDLHSNPVVGASSAQPGHEPPFAVDQRATTSWRSQAGPGPQWLQIDFQEEREYGGLIIDWEPEIRPGGFVIQTSNDAVQWKTRYTASHAVHERSYVYLPNCSSRFLRVTIPGDEAACGIVDIDVKPYDFSRSINAFFQSIAKSEAKGCYPKYLYGEQTYWSPVGIPDGVTRGLLNEEGMLEVDEGSFSIEPFLFCDGQLLTWADGAPTQTLAQDYLPIPSSSWRWQDIRLDITAFASGHSTDAILYVRYRLANTHTSPRRIRFFAALRPFQVTPPWQSFNTLGGVSSIRELIHRPDGVWVNRNKAVIPLTAPDQFGAAAFDQGSITEYLKKGGLPPQTRVHDDFGYASGALRYDLTIAPGGSEELYLAIPFGFGNQDGGANLLPEQRSGQTQFDSAVEEWRTLLGRVDISLPSAASGAADTFKTAAAHILINRDGAALQPGPRRYTRCWIRDGATMAAALLRLGCSREVKDFIHWYARHQSADGNIPCCVDRTGPDWLPEYDSLGEFVFTIMEYFRYTGDRTLLRAMWPAVLRTIDYFEILRSRRLTPEFTTDEKRACYGLLPESASHEGYLAHPVHAYWDDFWALRGLRDAAAMAEILDDQAQASRLAALRDDFQQALSASIRTTITAGRLDYVPGSVEWTDFDPTATANAITVLGELPDLPDTAIEQTFEQYLTGFHQKHGNECDWTNYSPYEIRIIGALVRLGKRQSALELLKFFLSDRRPLPWNQWPEIAWRDPKTPGHMGDIPHTWIGAEYILAFRSLFAFEREADQALVVGAGLADEWLEREDGVRVAGLLTWYGTLNFTARRAENGALHVRLGGDLSLPPGGIVLRPPGDQPLREARVNGKATSRLTSTEVVIEEFPAEVIILP